VRIVNDEVHLQLEEGATPNPCWTPRTPAAWHYLTFRSDVPPTKVVYDSPVPHQITGMQDPDWRKLAYALDSLCTEE